MTLPISQETVHSPDWQALKKGLLGYVHKRVPERDCDDVVADILEAIIRHRAKLQHSDNPSAWIYAIAKNKITDHFRKTARRHNNLKDAMNDPTFNVPDQQISKDDIMSISGLAICLSPLIAGMDRQDRLILKAIDLEEMRQTDYAAHHGIILPTVKSRIQRARQRLRNRLLACCPDGSAQPNQNCAQGCGPENQCGGDGNVI
ncbi:RNA polymerase sigma factor [Thalassospira alkalitolerans]|uniref:RNA polymerase sigma factor n=1 Tax=Thalassospira alkalitolerans TaxID=1293890 RepID=UPI003AA84417